QDRWEKFSEFPGVDGPEPDSAPPVLIVPQTPGYFHPLAPGKPDSPRSPRQTLSRIASSETPVRNSGFSQGQNGEPARSGETSRSHSAPAGCAAQKRSAFTVRRSAFGVRRRPV